MGVVVLWRLVTDRSAQNTPTGVFFFAWRKWMDRKEAHQKFSTQRSHARLRGIEWRLTFEKWLEWWGEDLDRRGNSPSSLQMQRFHDKGPYALGNIKKGRPVENMRTAGAVRRNREQERLAAEHQAALDAALVVSADPKEWEELSEDELELNHMFRCKSSRSLRGHFAADK